MNRQNSSSSPAYHGLINQGATCYLNSVLQVLFMTKEFRKALRNTAVKPDSEFIDDQLKSLFDALRSHRAHTSKITTKLGIKVYEQRDAAEYFEKILNRTSPEASQIFQGKLIHRNICMCGKEANTDAAFWSLPLALVDSDNEDYSVVDGIKKFFKPVDVSGDNQMYCDQCDAKADATVKCVINHHPEVLTLLLKRFKFDYHYMEFVKIQCSVDVPYNIQIPENQTYELYAFVEHFGSLRGGHYTATIKDDKKWYNFNDTMVTSLDNKPFQEKSKSAYILFYKKKTKTPEGLQLNNSKNCQDAEKTSKIWEREEETKKGIMDVKMDKDRNTGAQKQRKKKRGKHSRKDKFPVPAAETTEGFQLNNSKNCQDAEKTSKIWEREEETKKGIMDVKMDKDRNTGAQKQRKKKRGKHSRKDKFSKAVEHHDNHNVGKVTEKRPADYQDCDQETTDKSMRHENPQHNVGLNDKCEHQEGNQEHYGRKPFHMNKNKDEEKMVINVEEEEESRTGADEMEESGSEKSDLCNNGSQDNRKIGESEHNILKNNPECTQVNRKTSYTEDEEQSRRDIGRLDRQNLTKYQKQRTEQVNDLKFQDADNKGDEKTKVKKKVDRVGGYYQDIRRGGEIQQSKPDVEEKEKPGDYKHNKNREDVFVRQGSAGSAELMENQSVDTEDLTRSREQYKSIRGTQAETRLGLCSAEKNMRGGVSHTETVGQITHSGIKTKMTPGTDDEAHAKRKCDPKPEDQYTFTRTHYYSSVLDSPSPKAQDNSTKEFPGNVEKDNEKKSSFESTTKQMATASDMQVQSQNEKNEGQRRTHRKVKNEPNKVACFFRGLCCVASKKNADQDSQN